MIFYDFFTEMKISLSSPSSCIDAWILMLYCNVRTAQPLRINRLSARCREYGTVLEVQLCPNVRINFQNGDSTQNQYYSIELNRLRQLAGPVGMRNENIHKKYGEPSLQISSEVGA